MNQLSSVGAKPPMPYMTPPEQVEYLFSAWGYKTSVRTLAKLRCIGGGPKFVKIGGRRVLSRPDWMDEWITQKTSHPVTSTSQLAGATQ